MFHLILENIFGVFHLSEWSVPLQSSSSPWMADCKSWILVSARRRSPLAAAASASADSSLFSRSFRLCAASVSRACPAEASSFSSRTVRCSFRTASCAVCSLARAIAASPCNFSTVSFSRDICTCWRHQQRKWEYHTYQTELCASMRISVVSHHRPYKHLMTFKDLRFSLHWCWSFRCSVWVVMQCSRGIDSPGFNRNMLPLSWRVKEYWENDSLTIEKVSNQTLLFSVMTQKTWTLIYILLQNAIFWDVTSCHLLECSGRSHCLHYCQWTE